MSYIRDDDEPVLYPETDDAHELIGIPYVCTNLLGLRDDFVEISVDLTPICGIPKLRKRRRSKFRASYKKMVQIHNYINYNNYNNNYANIHNNKNIL
jgi:hypothetical protein